MARSKRINWLLSSFFALSMGLVASPSLAQSLYQVELPASADLLSDQHKALDLLLLRLTGDDASVAHPMVLSAKENIEPYLQQFRNHQQQRQVLFSASKIDELLRQAQLRLWQGPRPSMMIWWGHEEAQNRHIMSEMRSPVWLEQARAQAQRLGLNALWPIMDLQDTVNVSVNDIWGNFSRPLINASARYQVPLMVVVKQYPLDASQWQLDWRVVDTTKANSIASGKLSGELETLATQAMTQIHQTLAERFSVMLSDIDTKAQLLHIANVNSIDRLVTITQLLRKQSGVNNVSLQGIHAERASFSVKLLGNWNTFVRTLASENGWHIDQDDPSLLYLP